MKRPDLCREFITSNRSICLTVGLCLVLSPALAVFGDQLPGRIVSATLASDEILLEMIGPDRLVAVTAMARDSADSNCRHLAAEVPNHLRQADAEAILALHPDLVIVASFTRGDTLAALRHADVATLELKSFLTIEDVMANIRLIGQLVGCPERAEQMIAEMTARLQRVERVLQASDQRPQAALFSLDGYSAGARTLFDDVLRRAGGRNAPAEHGELGFAKLDPERWIVLNPDWLVIAGSKPRVIRRQLLGHRRYRMLAAVKNDRLIIVPNRYLSSVSHHVIEAVERIARGLHPELDWSERPPPTTTTNSAPPGED